MIKLYIRDFIKDVCEGTQSYPYHHTDDVSLNTPIDIRKINFSTRPGSSQFENFIPLWKILWNNTSMDYEDMDVRYKHHIQNTLYIHITKQLPNI